MYSYWDFQTRFLNLCPVPPGYRFIYLCYDGDYVCPHKDEVQRDKISIVEEQVIGMAIVERNYIDGPEQDVEFIVFDRGDSSLKPEKEMRANIDDSGNVYCGFGRLGLKAPGETCELSDLQEEVDHLAGLIESGQTESSRREAEEAARERRLAQKRQAEQGNQAA